MYELCNYCVRILFNIFVITMMENGFATIILFTSICLLQADACELQEAAQLAQTSSWLSKRSIKLFLATSQTALMFRNKDVHEYAKAIWHNVAASNQSLSDFFEASTTSCATRD